ncbi:hypothetical protein A9Q84_02510 [Halobacteriovorax marinus]|uniref:Lipoprotein n=1 Tax=Halobacteriovorax marinus TaxID=97084 RepID=A0A1Y5FCI7_9BACT|nr:hypothetical protein A9Q84_02510 [Halobacteriovorax marinus]
MYKTWPFFILFLLFSSCSKEQKFTSSDMWKLAVKKDPSIELILLTDPAKRVLCENYQVDGCIIGSGKRIKVRLIELMAMEFDSEENARKAALAYDQYYARNWFFDEVKGEPVLESFIKEVYGAKNPKKSK